MQLARCQGIAKEDEMVCYGYGFTKMAVCRHWERRIPINQ